MINTRYICWQKGTLTLSRCTVQRQKNRISSTEKDIKKVPVRTVLMSGQWSPYVTIDRINIVSNDHTHAATTLQNL